MSWLSDRNATKAFKVSWLTTALKLPTEKRQNFNQQPNLGEKTRVLAKGSCQFDGNAPKLGTKARQGVCLR